MMKRNRFPKPGIIQELLQTLNAKLWFVIRTNHYCEPA